MPIVGNNQVGRALPNIGFFGSQSWTPAYDMQAYVYVVGAGGSGGGVGSHGTDARAQGGAAGGCAVSFLTLLSSVTYTITIGAGGSVVSGSGNSNGNAGGNSSLAGSNITTMTGNGGAAGTKSTSGGSISANSGGSASGGTICNNTGGSGGAVSDSNQHLTGGGAVGIWTTGNSAAASSNSANTPSGGGTLNYDNDSLPDADQDDYSWEYSAAGMNILSPFPALFTSQNFDIARNASSDSFEFKITEKFVSGQFAVSWRNYANGNYGCGAASPFCGGWAMRTTSGHAYAGGGGMGGGGGGCLGGGQFYVGGGGTGGVLIFPVDMG
mgnify:CR=1 FL=1